MQYRGETFADVYELILLDLIDTPEFITSPRGKNINETLGAQITIYNPEENLFRNKVRGVNRKYLADELCLYFSGSSSAVDFTKASSFWGTLVENGQINSAYGNLIFTMEDTPDQTSQWSWAVDSLVKDNDSRQAIMHFNRPQHQYLGNKDFPCTVACQWFIRERQLYLITYMRSNDVFFGMTYDIPFFMLLMQTMQLSLAGRGIDVEVGEYQHFAGSLHAYEKDFPTIIEMIENDFRNDSTPLIDECPIFHPDIDRIIKGEQPLGNSQFIQWLANNSSFCPCEETESV